MTKFGLINGKVWITSDEGAPEFRTLQVPLSTLVQFVLDLPIEAVAGIKVNPTFDTLGEMLQAEKMRAGQRNRIAVQRVVLDNPDWNEIAPVRDTTGWDFEKDGLIARE